MTYAGSYLWQRDNDASTWNSQSEQGKQPHHDPREALSKTWQELMYSWMQTWVQDISGQQGIQESKEGVNL